MIQSSCIKKTSTTAANPGSFSFTDAMKNRWFQAGRAIFGLTLLAIAIPAASGHAQSTRHERRESNANRKRRIARTVAETYSHRYEVGGGGGYLRFRSGPAQQRDNQITFWASTLYALNPKLGILGEVRGGYGTAKLTNPLPSGNFLGYNPKISEYNFMAGPSYRLVKKEKLSVSAFAEGGAGLGKFDGDSKGLSSADIGVWTGNVGGSFSVGANIDYNFYPNLALRITPNYLGTTYGGTLQNTGGVNAGIVYRFGKIK